MGVRDVSSPVAVGDIGRREGPLFDGDIKVEGSTVGVTSVSSDIGFGEFDVRKGDIDIRDS